MSRGSLLILALAVVAGAVSCTSTPPPTEGPSGILRPAGDVPGVFASITPESPATHWPGIGISPPPMRAVIERRD